MSLADRPVIPLYLHRHLQTLASAPTPRALQGDSASISSGLRTERFYTFLSSKFIREIWRSPFVSTPYWDSSQARVAGLRSSRCIILSTFGSDNGIRFVLPYSSTAEKTRLAGLAVVDISFSVCHERRIWLSWPTESLLEHKRIFFSVFSFPVGFGHGGRMFN